jgi:putative FmdB family regulatory protein
MPVYEYKCKACNREFEYQQRMADPDKTDCEACGQPALERLISRTAFQLKGSGWYKDLYSSSKPEAKSTESTTKTDSPAAPASSDTGGSSSSTSSDSGGSSSSSTGSGSGSSGTSGGSSGTKAAAGAS